MESASIIGPVHIVRCTTVSQYFIARTNFPSPFSPSLSLSLSLSRVLSPFPALRRPFCTPSSYPSPLSILSSSLLTKRERERVKGTKPRHRFPLVLSSNTGGKYERATVSTISHRSLCSSASAIFLVYRVCLLPPIRSDTSKRKGRTSPREKRVSVILLPFPRLWISTRKREHSRRNVTILAPNSSRSLKITMLR